MTNTSDMNIKKRPDLLSALCILSFIGSTIAFFLYFLASVFFEKTSAIIIKYSNWHSTQAISPFYFTLFMALSAVSLVGAIRMWKLHRDGFFIYVLAQVILLILPVIWIGPNSFSVTGAIFTTIFVLGYALNWKYLR